MAVYRIAGIGTELDPKYGTLKASAEKYLAADGTVPEIRAVLPASFAEKKKLQFPEMDDETVEYFYTGVMFSYKALDYGTFVIHGSAISYRGRAYIFSADCGTGKSTHTAYWRQNFGNDVGIINDDKPAVKLEDGVFRVYGTPFSGKTRLNENVSFPIGALCFIKRAAENSAKLLSPGEALPDLLRQTLRPANEDKLDKLLSLADKFLKEVPIYSLGVTNSPDAAVYAEKTITRAIGQIELTRALDQNRK